MAHKAIIAVAGPTRETKGIKGVLLKEGFDEVHIFDVPDDYGEFPDTTGYEREDWATIESDMEDPALFPFMTKCMDACLQFTLKWERTFDLLGHVHIENNLHWPKFGGKVFAVTGHITSFKPDMQALVNVPISLN